MKQVFISSTFKDMQFERDLINAKVAPMLDGFLQKYAEKVHFGDLRWGVNTTELESEECSKKVLQVCLDQIEECKPYMIILIGERYGWIPPENLLCQTALSKGIDVSLLDKDLSVTQLEIEYGALLEPDLEGRIFFYFRNPLNLEDMPEEERAGYQAESSLHKKKIDLLKERILKTYPNFVRYYDCRYDKESKQIVGLEDFGEMVFNDLKEVFNKELDYLNSLSNEERAINNSYSHFYELAKDSCFFSDSDPNEFNVDFDYYYQMRFENNPVFEVVSGEPGMGAKTLMAQKFLRAKEEGYNVFCFSYGLDSFTTGTKAIVKTMIYQFEKFLEIENTSSDDINYLCELLEQYRNDKNQPYVYLFFINLPSKALVIFNKIAQKLPYLFGVGFCVHFRHQLNKDIPLPFYLKNKVTYLEPVGDETSKAIVGGILSAVKKELPPVVIKEMVERKDGDSPLYLALLTQRLIMLDNQDFAQIRAMGDGMDNINKYMISIIRSAGEDVTSIAKELFKELVERIGENTVLPLIAHLTNRYHFPEDGIRDLFSFAGWKYTAIDYALFKNTFPQLFYQTSSGMLFFSNDMVEDAAKQVLEDFGFENNEQVVIDFLLAQSEVYRRKAICFYYYEFGRPKEFLDYILNYLDFSLKEIYSFDNSLEKDKLKEKEQIKERFDKYVRYFIEVLFDSYTEDGEFALEVIKYYSTLVTLGKIKNPYTIMSFILEFIQANYCDKELINSSFDFIVKAIGVIESVNDKNNCEELNVFINIFRTVYLPTFLGKVTKVEQMEYFKQNSYICQQNGKEIADKRIELMQSKKLLISNAANRLTTSFYSYYEMVKSKEEVKSSEFEFFSHFCQSLENHAYAKSDKYYEKIISGEKEFGGEESQAFWLVMNGWRYKILKNKKKAKKNYDAFYAMHLSFYENGEMDTFFIANYLNLCADACEFFVENESKKEAKEKVLTLFNWGLTRLSENNRAIDFLAPLLRMFDIANEIEALNDAASYFYQLYPIITLHLKDSTNPSLETLAPDFFLVYAFVFEEEQNQRFMQFVSILTDYYRSLGRLGRYSAVTIIEELAHFTARYCYVYELNGGEILAEVLDQVFESDQEFFKDRAKLIDCAIEVFENC